VITSVGPEQEYFLVDRDMYLQREDLMLTGRTLFGAPAAKGQEMEDHYFGTLKDRVALYMKELNIELWKLGVTAKTQHNEVAPAQHELAPIYATTNIATDHNQLIMEVMKRVAGHHNLACLLHEKPFAGINGSGKHNNWSMVTSDGENLLEPGDTPHKNKQFLLFLAAVLAAVDDNAELLRVSAANPGNDHRLGANEAPPAIISVFLGDQLEDILEQIEKGALTSSKEGGLLDLGVNSLPTLHKDATDRNRTSPFAFTGNKFEFRMVPSSASISGANIVLNAIVADALCNIADELEKAEDFDKTVNDILARLVKDHRRIVFNGNGYSEDWVKEAEKRGLPNIKSMVEAIPALVSKKTVDLYAKHKIFTETESLSRAEMFYEQYIKTINIEAKTMMDMTKKQIMPAVMEYATQLADSINTIKAAADIDVSVQTDLLKDVTAGLVDLKAKLVKLEKVTAEAAELEGDLKAQAIAYRENVFAAMNELRVPADHLELMVDSNVWPFPTYADLLFRI
jgi:glutamine synthetase